MIKREKILIITVGGIAALFALRTVKNSYMGKLNNQRAQVAKLEQTLGKVESERSAAREGQRRWLEIGSQTLSMDPNEAKRHLRDDLYELTKKAGLTKEKVDVGMATVWQKNRVSVLPCTVIAEGQINEVVKFLFELYRQPYSIRCKSLSLAQVGGKSRKGLLKMTAKLDTLILPSNAMVKSIVPAKLGEKRTPVDRTDFAELAHYDPIVNKKMWEPYSPPQPGKASTPNPPHQAKDIAYNQPLTLTWKAGDNAQTHQILWGNSPPGLPAGSQPNTSMPRAGLSPGTTYYWRIDEVNEGGTTTGDVWSFTTAPAIAGPPPPPGPTAPPPPPPPSDGNMVLVRVISSARCQQAVLMTQAQDPAPPAPPLPDTRIEVGDKMFGGTLVLVHPKGAVTELNGALRFHHIGAQLQQFQPLTEQEQPEVYHEFKKLEARSAGISAGPG